MAKRTERLEDVTISQEESGYVIHVGRNTGVGTVERHACSTFAEVIDWLENYFTYRNTKVKNDPK